MLALVFLLFKWETITNLHLAKYNPFSKITDEYVSPYIYVLDNNTGEVMIDKNETKKTYPASLTKIMTTIVALEHIDDLNTMTAIDIDTYQEMVARNSSMAGFVGKEEVTLRDLLYGTMLSSGGKAANTLAIHVAGSVESFVHMMNEKANELDLQHTNFTNPEGLHDKNQYTTARDMAMLLNYVLQDGDFRAIFTKKNHLTTSTIDHPDGILLASTVLAELDGEESALFEIIGGKSGTTYEAGQCWATLGIVGEREYLAIVMGAPFKDFSELDQAQMADTIKIYETIGRRIHE